MEQEVIYLDGSRSAFYENGASVHDGPAAMLRLSLLALKSAIEIELNHPGMRLCRISAHQAIQNVLVPITGEKYKRSKAGKRLALSDTEALLYLIETDAVVWESNG